MAEDQEPGLLAAGGAPLAGIAVARVGMPRMNNRGYEEKMGRISPPQGPSLRAVMRQGGLASAVNHDVDIPYIYRSVVAAVAYIDP